MSAECHIGMASQTYTFWGKLRCTGEGCSKTSIKSQMVHWADTMQEGVQKMVLLTAQMLAIAPLQ